MLVRMKFQISGTRAGKAWPAPGNEIELSSDEAVSLLKSGMADAIENRQKAETSEAPKVEETREEEPKKTHARKPAARKPGRPRKAVEK